MLGTLYVVATPIGNLEDISLRALRILKEVDLILTEDTRQTSKLLRHYEIETSVKSYHQHSSDSKKHEILLDLISGKNLALVTDAGTPGLSDPGNELIDFLVEREPNIKIVPVPGASSLTAAISVSGVDLSKFVFLGFMPKKKHSKLFEKIKAVGLPFIYLDSPHRLIKNLQEIKEELGSDTSVVVCRELTKVYEEIYRGTISTVLETLEKSSTKGEVVVIVSPGRIELPFKV